jgi:uncharacterized protein (TIGR03382 family)
MRRAFLAASVLAALLAAPDPAQAQATPGPGQVTFDNAFIGAEACVSTATGNAGRQVTAAWADQLDTSAGNTTTSGVFRVWATNVNPTAAAGSTARYCPPQDNPNAQGTGPVYSRQVGDDIPNTGNSLSGRATVTTALLARAAGYGDCARDNVTVYVCVQFYPYTIVAGAPTRTPSTQATGWAIGAMTLSLKRAGAVTLDSVLPGNGALNVSWSDSNSPPAAKYKVLALSLADERTLPDRAVFSSPSTFAGINPLDPTPHESGFVTGTGPYRLSGLLNFLPYAVAVVAYTDAETPSDPSNVITSAPQVIADFWRIYKDDGGRDAGGCSSGAAGPVALVLLAGVAALVRRRK